MEQAACDVVRVDLVAGQAQLLRLDPEVGAVAADEVVDPGSASGPRPCGLRHEACAIRDHHQESG